MKRSGSDWNLDDLLMPDGDDYERSPSPEELQELLRPRPPQKTRVSGDDGGISFADVFGFGFMSHPDVIGNNPMAGQLTGSQIWSQSHNLTTTTTTPRHSSISATMESQSSLCTGSPTSSLKPKGVENQAPGGTSDSEQSDDESLEIEAGSCDQSTNLTDPKRVRRMVSNRESARRSRKRKQAHLAELELQVDQLREQNASLFKQLTGANHEFTEAVTDNRVLKSDVETLRVKVKMAEDLVTRGSLTCSLDHLLQSQIAVAPHALNTRNLCRASEVPPPIIDLQVNEGGPGGYNIGASANGQVPNMGMNQGSPLQSIASLDNLHSVLSSEISSCGADIWSPNVMSKQF